jgi:Tfp pilus assembly protein PilP
VLTLRKLNLLGIFGTDNDLRALVRLPGGRVRQVRTGTRLAAGKVVAIDAEGLILLKGTRSTRIALPGG